MFRAAIGERRTSKASKHGDLLDLLLDLAEFPGGRVLAVESEISHIGNGLFLQHATKKRQRGHFPHGESCREACDPRPDRGAGGGC